MDPQLNGDHSASDMDLRAREGVGQLTALGTGTRGCVKGLFSAVEVGDMILPI